MDSGEVEFASFIKKILKFHFNDFHIFIIKAQLVEKDKNLFRPTPNVAKIK